MRERIACEFRLVRYVPDVPRGEFANIGVILREVGGEETMMIRFARSWTYVRGLHADVDVLMLTALEAELQQRLRETAEERPLLEVLEGSLSNQVQVTPPRACLAESLPAEMDRLMQLYVDLAPRVAQPREGGRSALLAAMRRAFESAGVWTLMRKDVRAAEYTGAGDPLRLDCGYRPNGSIRLFQAVALRGEMEGAKVLAYAAKDLKKGFLEKEGAELEMTAIVSPLRDQERNEEEVEQYRFAVSLMEREAIRVMTTKDLERIAETARRELRV